MNHKTNEEQNGAAKNTGKIIGLDLVFVFLTYLIGLSMNRFLGIVGDPENPEKFNPVNLSLGISTFSFLYFASIDGLLILDKRIDRRILIFSGILVFLVLASELFSISNWILFFYKMFWKTTAELEADHLGGVEKIQSEVQQILSASLFLFAIVKTIVRIIWNIFWIKAILAQQKVSDSSLN
ncbi:hypothetical protein A0128_05640 [Leptospira tipperaryensis]|uniref:Uncharacterized protein n=1 Tax=Leptospira tipperaryensis TaxID=2564040 RepID=A0A1D7UV03_9LEPT|nr:hypothetical protein [Leptospira tipperaryensis]AOP33371.1 hypothetical protein A0128_05640 [Leptospira tipperaryensis]